jgi:Kef-type K+ transport system membrane component KefB
VCFIAGALVTNFPCEQREDIFRILNHLERPIHLLFLIVAGAIWNVTALAPWLLVPVFVIFGSAGIGCFTGMMLGLFIRKVEGGHALFATMMCIVIAEVSVPLHLDPLIVMLAAGLYLENVSDADAHKLIDGFEAASLPVYLVFFALAGVTLDIDGVVSLIIPVTVICLVRAAVFWAGCRVAARRTDADDTIARFAWLGLVPQAGLALALAVIIGRTYPSFGPQAEGLIIGVVAVNQLIPPILLRLALLRSGEAGKRVQADESTH